MQMVGWMLLLVAACAGCATGGWSEDRLAPGLVMERAASAPDQSIQTQNQGTAMTGWSDDVHSARGFSTFGSSRYLDTDDDGLPDTIAPNQPPPPREERMLIYTGEVRVEVAHAEESAARFLAEVEALGGYLQQQSGTSLTLRLPAKSFDGAYEKARGLGRVLAESRRASDVTEEFVDLGIRVDNARKSRDRLLEILKIADKVEDILKVETELRRLTEEIERMEGRLKFLRDQVAMATLQVDFQSVAAPPPPRRVQQPSRFRWVNRVGVRAVMEGF